MDDEKDTKKKKKGFFGGILRAKGLASRAKGKVFRDRENSSSSPEDRAKLKPKSSRQFPVTENDTPTNVKRQTRKNGLNGGAYQRRADGNTGLSMRNEDLPRRENGAATSGAQRNGGENIPRKKSRTIEPVVQPIENGPKSSRRRPRRPKPLEKDEELDSPAGEQKNKFETPEPPVLSQWPPPGISTDGQLPPAYAMELIARGAPIHRGHKRPIPHAPENYYALYATTSSINADDTDAVSIHEFMVPLMTLRPQGPGRAMYPWETLEQPSCAFLYGLRQGTITLNQWISMNSSLPPTIALRDSGILPRSMDLYRIMERLQELQAGLEDDDENLLYRILYKRILRDPDRILNPHKTLDKQITDLLLVLSRPDWIDFTDKKNQVVTRFIFNTEFVNPLVYKKFFHQLLLSLELELRIHSRQHGDWAKEKLLGQIPPTIRWNLALARRWRENVRIDGFGESAEQTKLRYKLKKRQVKVLKKFAQAMKWPNLSNVMENLRIHDEEFRLDSISSDAFAFFSGLVLPGPTFPFLIMNTLIDLDPDSATDNLALLSHNHPQSGFQYRNSHTYWSASCIVGKVLAPTCHAVAGWIGPCRRTSDLSGSQIARIRTRRPKHQERRLGPEDVESMGERSDCLGPAAQSYPVEDYTLVVPDEDSFAVDTVRIELLGFKPVVTMAEDTYANGPRLFDANIQFAIDGVSWPLRLMYDVNFVMGWPCSQAPHPLFFDYVYRVVKADEVVRVRDWGGLYYKNLRNGGSASARSSPAPPFYNMGFDEELDFIDDDGDDEKVLVVEAYGVPDNEVLARAWCSHWGLSAVVADIRKTW
ncbi:hypothetical protein QQS21_012461 [Conoideocrella luteorostrata]|uniref:VTC domain-containing protein n=1 Tax=Conoideocrella luteorostrata TaxID=1105319 RepID=A0AAJ0CC93_9HYPO|nr:hypothetical protein QQS21_012461 [Conoideocrella luteorostrata]